MTHQTICTANSKALMRWMHSKPSERWRGDNGRLIE